MGIGDWGFLSVNKPSRREHLDSLKNETRTMLFYEAPHKLGATLKDMQKTFGNREMAIVREITKIHEEVIRTTLDKAVELYEKGAAYRILMTGDRDDEYYDEVSVMRDYAISRGVPPVAVMIDPEGYSTYESMYRAERDFEVEKALVVTQRYHLYRSVYDARLMGIKADGVVCVSGDTDTEDSRREFLARIKDFVYTILRPEPETIQEYRLENPEAAAQFQ